VCRGCHRSWALCELRWRCTCGGLLDLVGPRVDPLAGAPPGEEASPLRRYRPALPPGAGVVDLGLTVTALVEAAPRLYVKCDYQHPTGSFKDRGASAMMGVAAGLGVEGVIVDSSGNAGRAVAAHAAAASMQATVYVPADTAPAKVSAITRYGATVVEVAGGRAAAGEAAQRDVGRRGLWYASHVHQPLFHHGVKTLAFELYEQLPGLESCTVVVPAGNGTLVLGLWLGFEDLVAAGRLPRPPKLVAVQAERCAPLAGRPPLPGSGSTAATGIAIAAPPRGGQVRAAVQASGGRVVTVGEEAIERARSELRGLGFEGEPTGAVAWAAAPAVWGGGGPGEGAGPVVAVLTGR
jgi:threonine synthase